MVFNMHVILKRFLLAVQPFKTLYEPLGQFMAIYESVCMIFFARSYGEYVQPFWL